MCDYKCFQIELSRGYDYLAFHDDLKKLYDMTGVKNQNTVFLFTDTQVRRLCFHFVCLFVCLLAELCKGYSADFH